MSFRLAMTPDEMMTCVVRTQENIDMILDLINCRGILPHPHCMHLVRFSDSPYLQFRKWEDIQLQCKIRNIEAPVHLVGKHFPPLRPSMPMPESRLIPDAVAKPVTPLQENVALGGSNDEVVHSSDEEEPLEFEVSE